MKKTLYLLSILLLAGCSRPQPIQGSSTTENATLPSPEVTLPTQTATLPSPEVTSPTQTITEQSIFWENYIDENKLLEFKYPSDWFLSEKQETDDIFSVTLTPFNPSDTSKKSTEINVPPDQFMITFYIEQNVNLNTLDELSKWVSNSDAGRGKILSITKVRFNGYDAIEKTVEVTSDYKYQSYYLIGTKSLISIVVENVNVAKSEIYNEILSSMKITQ